jgi:hypothetical protein
MMVCRFIPFSAAETMIEIGTLEVDATGDLGMVAFFIADAAKKAHPFMGLKSHYWNWGDTQRDYVHKQIDLAIERAKHNAAGTEMFTSIVSLYNFTQAGAGIFKRRAALKVGLDAAIHNCNRSCEGELDGGWDGRYCRAHTFMGGDSRIYCNNQTINIRNMCKEGYLSTKEWEHFMSHLQDSGYTLEDLLNVLKYTDKKTHDKIVSMKEYVATFNNDFSRCPKDVLQYHDEEFIDFAELDKETSLEENPPPQPNVPPVSTGPKLSVDDEYHMSEWGWR